MSLLSVDELTARVETHLTTPALQSLIDDIEAEIAGHIGAYWVTATAISETHMGNGRNLYLKRKITSVSSVTEYASITDSGSALTEGTHYSVWTEQGRLERVGNWGWKVVVSYIPQDDRRAWKQAVIDIARIDIARMPMKAEGIQGEMSYTAPDNWEYERAQCIHRLMFTEV